MWQDSIPFWLKIEKLCEMNTSLTDFFILIDVLFLFDVKMKPVYNHCVSNWEGASCRTLFSWKHWQNDVIMVFYVIRSFMWYDLLCAFWCIIHLVAFNKTGSAIWIYGIFLHLAWKLMITCSIILHHSYYSVPLIILICMYQVVDLVSFLNT